MRIRIIIPNAIGNSPGKLAEAEIHFDDAGPLTGLKLIGFGVWERRDGRTLNVTFPARQYTVNGERRSFALLRPTSDTLAQDRLRNLIIDAYRAHIAEQEDANTPSTQTPDMLAALNSRTTTDTDF